MIFLFLESVDLPPPFTIPNLSQPPPPPLKKEPYALYHLESKKKKEHFSTAVQSQSEKERAYFLGEKECLTSLNVEMFLLLLDVELVAFLSRVHFHPV